jgi:hypothetical protein
MAVDVGLLVEVFMFSFEFERFFLLFSQLFGKKKKNEISGLNTAV